MISEIARRAWHNFTAHRLLCTDSENSNSLCCVHAFQLARRTHQLGFLVSLTWLPSAPALVDGAAVARSSCRLRSAVVVVINLSNVAIAVWTCVEDNVVTSVNSTGIRKFVALLSSYIAIKCNSQYTFHMTGIVAMCSITLPKKSCRLY